MVNQVKLRVNMKSINYSFCQRRASVILNVCKRLAAMFETQLNQMYSMIKYHLRLSSLLLCVFISLMPVASLQAKTFIVGVENVNLYPFYDFNKVKPRGYLVELIQKFAEHEGFDIEFRVMPPKELWIAYLNSDVDFRMPDNITWKRSRKMDYNLTYSAPLVYFNSGVISLSENKNRPISKLGTIKGFTAWSYKDQVDSGLVTLVEETGTENMIRGLFSGRTDGVYYNVEAFIQQVQDSGYEKERVIFRRELLKSHSLYMLSSINYGEKVYAFNQFLRDNRDWVRERKRFYGIDVY